MFETKPFAVGRGNHATVNNLRMYYEIHGAGQPLVVLQGGAGGIEMLGSNLEALAKKPQSHRCRLPGARAHAGYRPLRVCIREDNVVGSPGRPIVHLQSISIFVRTSGYHPVPFGAL